MKTAEEVKAYRAAWRRLDRSRNPSKYKDVKRRHYEKHRDKILEDVKAYQLENAERIAERKKKKYACWDYEERRNSSLLRNYGISLSQYNSMYTEQSGRCAVCDKHEDILSVDHCHQAGKIRGLLCDKCNMGLGLFKDRPELLRMAALYLESEAIIPEHTVPKKKGKK